AGIYSFGKGLIDRDPIRGSDTSYKRMTPLKVGDLVMSKLNGWEGALAVVDEPFDGYYVSNEYPVFEVDTERITTSFLAALVATPSFWQALDDATRGSMVRRRRVHPSGLLKTVIWLPPLAYQDQIGEHLEVLREVGGEERRTELLEAVMPSLLNATFGEAR
ncbi:MAG: hypothetical protein M3O70_22875, partial [Actinomycetota bacterium]|nr:hypothetical protein [Actinomycetota bacterium]